ncbi:MAG: hypothetical protein H6865_04365 [Rhodospirillales bacterium]|nr:hypothetical protein [Alphaproteobacteria bacterium]MCB9986852.1 hypothetical protein [Rhodospirillales bacterium]USO08386.1 MAG: hypothetical protein H6866_04015 [Rhodospirillales bacterium]
MAGVGVISVALKFKSVAGDGATMGAADAIIAQFTVDGMRAWQLPGVSFKIRAGSFEPLSEVVEDHNKRAGVVPFTLVRL